MRELRKDEKAKKKVSLKSVWPMVWALVRPRRGLLLLGLLLMAVNRVAGLVAPASTKWLVDNVINKHQAYLLRPIVLFVLGATAIQGITSFALTQLLSKEAQRLIAELRRDVQAHISRLPLGYFDANKTGMLVSRIMTDVEGVRNLIGTGLVEFAGGLLTAAIAFVLLVRISPLMTGMAFAFVTVFMLVLQVAFKKLRPIFRDRGRINAEVTGRLTETLGGIRVVKGYHAEKREQAVFAAGVQRLLENVLKTLTGTSVMALVVERAAGGGRRAGDVDRSDAGARRAYDDRSTVSVHRVSRLPGGAGVSDRADRHADHGGAGGARAYEGGLRHARRERRSQARDRTGRDPRRHTLCRRELRL